VEGLTKDEFKQMLQEKYDSLENQIEEARKNNASKEEVADLVEQLKELGQSFDDFVEEQKSKVVDTVMKQYSNFLQENKDALEQIKNSKSGTIEFKPDVSKVVGDMSTGSGGDAAAAPVNHNTALGTFNLRNDNDLLSLFSVTQTDRDSLVYTELEPKDGGYEFVGEGGTKPQIDFKWTNRYSTPKKAAAYLVLSEESVTDIARLESAGREFLTKKHDLFKVDGLFFGDGVTVNPEGATTIGRVFAAGDMALAVDSPNFMDTVNACVTDIYTTHNYTDEAPYEANIVLINPVDFYLELVSAKDTRGLPLYPQAGLFNSVSIGGVTIKPWSKIPAGKIFVADCTKYHVGNYVPFSIRIGWINDQFITNQFTILGESRFHAWVENLDRQAFIYDDIATIKTAITAI